TLRRVPPQSVEAEQSVLGGILLDNTALDRLAEVLQPDDFYREAHRKIFRGMQRLSERNEPVDLITLSEELRGRGGELADRRWPASAERHTSPSSPSASLRQRTSSSTPASCATRRSCAA